jgi:hypothetical protein
VNTGTLSGIVVDAQGLAVHGAKLTLTNAGTRAERNVISDDAGVTKWWLCLRDGTK